MRDRPNLGIRPSFAKVQGRIGTATLGVLLMVLSTLPSLSIMLLNASSLALGLTVGSLLIVVAFCWSSWSLRVSVLLLQRHILILGTLLGACVLHGLIASAINGFFDWSRALSSLGLVALTLLAAIALRELILQLPSLRLIRMMWSFFFIFAIEGVLALLGVPSVGPSYHHQPIIFFIEPSQYSLAFLPFVTFLVISEQGRTRLTIVFITLALGLLIKSLTLLVGLGVVVALMFPLRRLIFVVALVLPLLLLIDTSYFAERLAFSDDVENLSSLAFLQGWERALLNIQNTHGVGVGFQQFGLVGELGFFQERIESLFNLEGLNILDGGTNGSKLIGEFGLFGVLGLLIYLALIVLSVAVSKLSVCDGDQRIHAQFFSACLIAGFTEFFVRGGGYMTPGMLLVAMGSMWIVPREALPRLVHWSSKHRLLPIHRRALKMTR